MVLTAGRTERGAIISELQQVRVGCLPDDAKGANDVFVVRMVEPERSLVLGDAAGGMSWALVREPIDETATRLVTHSRGAYDDLALGVHLKGFSHPLDFGRQPRQLVNSSGWWRRQHDGATAANILG